MVRAFTVGIDGLSLAPDETAFLRDAAPWGVILFARNIDSPPQVGALCASIREALGRDAPIMIDQEGGRVQRMAPPHWRQWLPPLDHVAASGGSSRAMYLRGLLIGDELRRVGIDVNCAPTCDVATPDTHPFLRNRCFGDNARIVTTMARALSDGLLDAGVLPVMKHIPGHGRGRVDSHINLPVSDADHDTLTESDFVPFRALADLPMAMTAHMLFSALDARAATVSPVLIDIIRRDISFDGLLMTDDISMEALGGSITERALAALDAGCDLVLHCNGDLPERRVLAGVVPEFTPKAAGRAQSALARRRTPAEIDIPSAEAELAGLMTGLV